MFSKLLAKFDECENLPIEISEIQTALVQLGCQDEIYVDAVEMDTTQLMGTFDSWVTHKAVYGDPVHITQIGYHANFDIKLQRMICAKELVHICDPRIAQTRTLEDIKDLLELLPFILINPNDHGNLSPAQRAEITAVEKGLMLLFPKRVRAKARGLLAENKLTLEILEEKALIPRDQLEKMLDKDFERRANQLQNG